jgi:hypothetical protein
MYIESIETLRLLNGAVKFRLNYLKDVKGIDQEADSEHCYLEEEKLLELRVRIVSEISRINNTVQS